MVLCLFAQHVVVLMFPFLCLFTWKKARENGNHQQTQKNDVIDTLSLSDMPAHLSLRPPPSRPPNLPPPPNFPLLLLRKWPFSGFVKLRVKQKRTILSTQSARLLEAACMHDGQDLHHGLEQDTASCIMAAPVDDFIALQTCCHSVVIVCKANGQTTLPIIRFAVTSVRQICPGDRSYRQLFCACSCCRNRLKVWFDL